MICKFEELYQQEAQSQRARYEDLRNGFILSLIHISEPTRH